MLQAENGTEIVARVNGGGRRRRVLRAVRRVPWQSWRKGERHRDDVGRPSHVRDSHLPSRVVAAVGGMGPCEVKQIAGRERRGDGRQRERHESVGEDASENRAMRGPNHDADSITRTPPPPSRTGFGQDGGNLRGNPRERAVPARSEHQTFLFNRKVGLDICEGMPGGIEVPRSMDRGRERPQNSARAPNDAASDIPVGLAASPHRFCRIASSPSSRVL